MALYSQFRGRDRFHGAIPVSDVMVRKKDYVIGRSMPGLTITAPTVAIGTAATGNFTSAGTGVFELGSAGTITLTGHGLGTAKEVYFCNAGASTAKALPLGCTAFAHYYTHTRGYAADTFTVGTSPTGTAGTQCNFTGTSGTHTVWKSNV